MRESHALAITKGVVLAFWTVVLSIVLVAAMPDNPLRLPSVWQQSVFKVTPEGWGFFTRNPRSPVDHVYKRVGDDWVRVNHTNADVRNIFGIRKGTRMMGIELVYLQNKIQENAWQPCAGDIETCLRTSGKQPTVTRNESMMREVCGEYVIDRRPPVPWAWSRPGGPERMPGNYLHLVAQCAN